MMENTAHHNVPKEGIMRTKHIRLAFLGLAALVAALTIFMHMHMGSGSRMILYELFSMDWAQYDNHPKAAVGRGARRFFEEAAREAPAKKSNVLPVPDDSELKALHKHSHPHNEEVRLVLRESHLGAPAFVGRNILDMGGGADVYGKQGRGKSAIDNLGNLSLPAWVPVSAAVNSIAIGLAITTRKQGKLTADNLQTDLPFFKGLLTSFCYTASAGYDYHFYIGHDHNDPFFMTDMSHQVFDMSFYSVIAKACPKVFNVSLHLVECNHTGRPAWAQNDAMMAAYMDNMEFYYRVNDDTIMESSGWTEKFIEELQRYNPANVGVVGPWFKEGNYQILTHDFVHRTHIDIFGYYYPRVFTDWFADNWITMVYFPERSRKAPGTRVKHTMEQGSRYVVHFDKAEKVSIEVEIGKNIISRWLTNQAKVKDQNTMMHFTSNLVISMSLYGDDLDSLYGAMRYTQLASVMYPDWRIRFYVQNFTKEDQSISRVLKIVVRKLELSGSEIVRLPSDITSTIPPTLWKYLIADDDTIQRFLIRESNTRPSERESEVLADWLKGNASWHCVRDHPSHALMALVPGLTGGIPQQLKSIFSEPWASLMKGFTTETTFLEQVVWPAVNKFSLCHDSVSCLTWKGAPFPILRKENIFVGQRYDANDEIVDSIDTMRWNSTYTQPDCVFIKNTGFSESAVRSVIRHRPVFWSQDFHVTPIMDIRSLLTPIGVKVIDKSLSYYCQSVGTCAKNLKVINRNNGMHLTHTVIDKFYEYYHNKSEMQQVTTFVCTLPVSMCEAFLHFNKSILIIATMRYEHNKEDIASWHYMNQMLIKISQRPRSLIAANNLYDVKYIEYFTGIQPILIPNYCAYISDSYTPKRREFLVTPIHSTDLSDRFFSDFDNAVLKLKAGDLTIFPLREMYPQYLFSDIAAHPGIIYIPYQVSMVSLTEQYRMNIPLFCPSISLLAKWHMKFQVVRQRTWAGAQMKVSNSSSIRGLRSDIPDPNNDLDEESVRYWLQYADYYRWPHIIYFDNIEDLVHKLVTLDLKEVSRQMAEHNRVARDYIKRTWSRVMLKLNDDVTVSR